MKIYDESHMGGLRKMLEEKILEWDNTEAKKMFGCPSYTVDGTLFASLRDDALVLHKLNDDARAQFSESLGGVPFEAQGKTMGKWLQIAFTDEGDLDDLLFAAKASYESARAQ
jgi:TfoX/Sxy family transcriptional regulator of competence genes